jgi:hypothetical protein
MKVRGRDLISRAECQSYPAREPKASNDQARGDKVLFAATVLPLLKKA